MPEIQSNNLSSLFLLTGNVTSYADSREYFNKNFKLNYLKAYSLLPGEKDYKKAEVTVGGVDTRDLSQQTMESKQPGLYFIGEVVDITGWLGGYNFQWAWASAHACAKALGERFKTTV